VITVAFAVDGPKLGHIQHQHPNQHCVTKVTIIFRPHCVDRSTDPQQERTSFRGLGLLKILKQCATEFGTVAYTFVGLDEYLEFCSFKPQDGPRPITIRRYKHVFGYIKSQAIKAGTYKALEGGLKLLSHDQYRQKVGNRQYDLDTCAGWEGVQAGGC